MLSNLVQQMRKTHFDLQVDVIASRHLYRGSKDAELLPAYEEWDGVRIFRVNSPKVDTSSTSKRLKSNVQFSIAALRKLLSLPRYDAVLVSTAPPPLAAAARIYRQITGTPYGYVIYDLYPDIAMALNVVRRQSRAARLLQHQQKKWLHSASKNIVLGRCMADYLTQNYAVPSENIDVIAVGANADRVTPRDKNTQFRAKHDLNGFVAMWAGNFGWHQNFDTILDAAKILSERHSSVQFVFVGDGMRLPYIAERVKKEQIDNVRLLPFVPDEQFADMMASADVSFVALEQGAEGLGVPSKFYNILASARPTVALVAPDSEVARVLQEAQCGIRVDQNDPVQLADTLFELSNDVARLEQMGQNARQVCLEKYSMQCVSRSFYDTLQNVAAMHRKPLSKSREVVAKGNREAVADESLA